MKNRNKYKFLFAGGGTGGHLYPAIAVADKLMEIIPASEILFVGTKNKIEARVVPQKGYAFKSIWVSGISRKLNLKNLLFPVKIFVAALQSFAINLKFKPSVAIGTGAYVSGPAVWAASILGSKIMLLEQNSFPGLTNRLLEKRADEIHISFDESKKFFRYGSKLKLSGNPVRVIAKKMDRNSAAVVFGLNPEQKIVFVIGGSLGAESINEAIKNIIQNTGTNFQFIWQCGDKYYEKYSSFNSETVKVFAFIDKVQAAYSAADLIVARAGATTIAEVSALGLPVIFVPSSNVTADHQYKNAVTLEKENAAVVIRDSEVNEKLFRTVNELLNDENKMNQLKINIRKFSKADAADVIARSAIKLAEKI